MLVKELLKESNAKSINTHIGDERCNYLMGFFSAKELIKYYGECECKQETYEDLEQDVDSEVIINFRFLIIYSDDNYSDEILKERGIK